MSKKNQLASAFFLALCAVFFALAAQAQTITSRNFDERFVIRSVGTIHGAQMTYQATFGNGAFGSLENLRQANFIDGALAGGEKYGYIFALSVTPPTSTMPAKFTLTATPRLYRKSGRLSYFVDERGEVRGADKNGGVATANDPIVDSCSFYGDIAGNERCVIQNVRSLHGAQITYQSTTGAGFFGTLSQLFAAGLINSGIASGTVHGYNFVVSAIAPAPNSPAFFIVQAVPTNYGVTGTRSFYIDAAGVLRGADKQGLPADENDPPINDQDFKD
jgi:hypothetical protein